MRIRAALYPNVELRIKEAKGSMEQQLEDVYAMIEDDMDVIIISALMGDAIVPAVELAMAKGIPVITLDRKISTDNYAAYVGADNLEVGRNAAKYIASVVDERVKIIEIPGGAPSSPDIERSKGFAEAADVNDKLDLVLSIPGGGDGIIKEHVMRVFDSIPKNQNYYVYVFSDRMALEAWQVARDVGVEKNLRFIGVDGLNGANNGIDLVRKGILEATILYPTGGQEAIELAVMAAKGEEVPKTNKLISTIIDRHNADIMKNQLDRIEEQQEQLEHQVRATQEQEEKYLVQKTLLFILLGSLFIVVSLSVYSIYSIMQIRKKNRQLMLQNDKITLQRNKIEQIAQKIKEVDETKFNFFTGLSHEFKTPLTLIMSSIESMRDSKNAEKLGLRNEIDLIQNNSQRLLRLMNSLLDFRKSEESKFNLRASKTNIYDFTSAIFNEFSREAKKRNISLALESNDKTLEIYFDRNLMDKVYFNLLSNALKFTPDGGKIEIQINDKKDKNYITIIVKDNGIGIPKDELEHVFEPFFKGSNNRKNSTGIGLHLSKKFIELHLGKIEVSAAHGTSFCITLFKGDKHFNEDQLINETEVEQVALVNMDGENAQQQLTPIEVVDETVDKYKIIVVEDNIDLSSFLKSKLSKSYEVLLSDGTDAIELALEVVPDLMICDINLPEKNGFEICGILKKDLRTSHIPIIILTALNDKESYIKGLNSGADAYLTKPFNFSILMQSIKSLLYNRERLRYYYSNNLHKIGDNASFDSLEQEFVRKMNKIIDSNLDNSNFTVEHLAEELGVSRVQLYRKVKAMMGISISDYIANFRLEQAKAALTNMRLSISEVAYNCGFSSPNYFSTAFKNKYGLTPAAFRKSI